MNTIYKLEKEKLFSNKMIFYFIIPMAIEKALSKLLTIANNIMVSHLGEDFLAGLSLASQINTVIDNIFMGFVLGGMILVTQLLGSNHDANSARKIVSSLLTFLTLMSLFISMIVFFCSNHIISLLYGQLNTQSHNSAITYLRIIALTYPMQVIYLCCTDLFRAMKNSKTPMKISIVMNIINILCNYIFIYQFHMGVVGAALGTLVARYFSTIIIFLLLCNKRNAVYFEFNTKIDFSSLKRILFLGIPTMTDKGMFQLGKLGVASILSTFGSVQIAANVIVSNIDLLIELIPDLVAIASTTIIGHCIGAKDLKQVKHYIKKLMFIGILSTLLIMPLMLSIICILHHLYDVSNEAWHLAMILTMITYPSMILFYVPSFTLANILRATGDVKFVMVISILSMWVFRFGGSCIIAKYFESGVIGIKLAMVMDWTFRSIMFIIRYKSGKWQKSRV